jgi:sodium-dependent dicarboxylate transporter 2/3/5
MQEIINNDTTQGSTGWFKSLLIFLTCLLVAAGTTYLIKVPEFSQSQVYVLFLLFFSIGLWVTEVIPPFATGLFIIAFLVFSLGNPNFNADPQDISKYANTFSSSVIWLMLGGFFLASAMSKTKLDIALFSFTVRVSGAKPRNLVIGLMATAMIASMLMSNTACTAMIVAAVTPLVINLGQHSGIGKAVLLGVPVAASTGGMATIIGTPPNVIAAGALENAGQGIDFLGWMVYGLPLAFVLTSICCLALLLYYVKDNKPIDLEFLKVKNEVQSPKIKIQRRIVIVILIVTLLMWLTGELHGIGVAAVSAIPIVFLTLTSVLTGKEVRALPWDTLFLVAGGLSLGVALQFNGLLTYYAGQMTGMNVSPLAYLFVFGYVTMAFSNVMSHTATATVLIPLGMAILPGSKTEIAMIVSLASSTAMLLPVSTPPNAIAFSTGLLQQKDFRLGGILAGLLGPLLVILWVMAVS